MAGADADTAGAPRSLVSGRGRPASGDGPYLPPAGTGELDRPGFLDAIPADAAIVIEIGCAEGRLGGSYRRRNPGVRYLGVEEDRTVAAHAARRLDRVVVGRVASLSDRALLTLPDGTSGLKRIDCVVWSADVQSQLDPASLLRRQAGWLGTQGVVVASVWSLGSGTEVQERIAAARADSGKKATGSAAVDIDSGVLEPFTREGVYGLFQRAGLTVVDGWELPRQGDPPRLPKALPRLLGRLGIDAGAFLREIAPTRWIVRAQLPGAGRSPLAIQAMTLRPQAGMVETRVLEPGRHMGSVPGVRCGAAYRTIDFAAARGFRRRVFLWQRPVLKYPDDLKTIRRILDEGYLIVMERDDYPWRPEFGENRFLPFRGVHAIQTSTDTLAEVLRQWNPNVAVFRNQLAELPPRRRYPETGPVTIFFGALNRQEEWEPLMGTLNAVLGDYGDRVAVQVIYDRQFFEALETPYKRFEPLCPYARYQQILRTCDIALLPLRDTLFNRCKSDLKFVECAGHGVAVLASPTVYAESLVNGETGLLFDTPEELGARLRLLIDDRTLRRRLATNAYEYVRRSRLMSQHFRERIAWYDELLERLPQLNAELLQRVPELASPPCGEA